MPLTPSRRGGRFRSSRVQNQSEYTLIRPSDCPTNQDHLRRPTTAQRDSMTLNEVSYSALGAEERSDEAPRAGRPRPTPDPEVVAKPKRRQFSAEYGLRILEEAERCTRRGEVGRPLRHEGLYSSHLTAWRKARRRQDQELQRQLRRQARSPAGLHLGYSVRDIGVGERRHVLPRDGVTGQGGIDDDSRRIVRPLALRDGPAADRRDTLLHPAGRLALRTPDRLQHRHDVPRGNVRYGQFSHARVDVGFQTGPPLGPGLRTAPGRLVHADDRLGCFGEGRCHGRTVSLPGSAPHMGNDKVVSLAVPAVVEDALTELLRTGARRLIEAAVAAEFEECLSGWRLLRSFSLAHRHSRRGRPRRVACRWPLRRISSQVGLFRTVGSSAGRLTHTVARRTNFRELG